MIFDNVYFITTLEVVSKKFGLGNQEITMKTKYPIDKELV